MRKGSICIACIFLLIFISGCSVSQIPTETPVHSSIEITTTPEPVITPDPQITDSQPDNLPDSEWKTDITGNFSYLKLVPSADGKSLFLGGGKYHDLMEYEFPNNKFMYEEIVNGIKMYGYIDENFKKLSQPISTEPYVFQLGLARIQGENDSYIINSDMTMVEEYYPGFVVHNNSVIKVTWTDKPVDEPFVAKNINLDEYIVPVEIYSDTKSSEGSGNYKIGFAPVGKVISGSVTKEECTISPIYEEARLFHDGLAAVQRFGYWGFINENGDTVIECKYDEVRNFYSGVTSVLVNDLKGNGSMVRKWSIINKEDESLSGFIYEEIFDYHGGVALAIFATKPGTNLVILDIEGKPICDRSLLYYGDKPQKNYDYRFHEGYMKVASAGECFIDINGESPFLIAPNKIRNFSNGLVAVKEYYPPYWGYIDTSGECVIGYKYAYVQDFYRGYALVRDELFSPGYFINKEEEKFLENLNLFKMTKFNEEGYTFAYGLPDGVDKIKLTINQYGEIEMGNEIIHYMIKINGDD